MANREQVLVGGLVILSLLAGCRSRVTQEGKIPFPTPPWGSGPTPIPGLAVEPMPLPSPQRLYEPSYQSVGIFPLETLLSPDPTGQAEFTQATLDALYEILNKYVFLTGLESEEKIASQTIGLTAIGLYATVIDMVNMVQFGFEVHPETDGPVAAVPDGVPVYLGWWPEIDGGVTIYKQGVTGTVEKDIVAWMISGLPVQLSYSAVQNSTGKDVIIVSHGFGTRVFDKDTGIIEQDQQMLNIAAANALAELAVNGGHKGDLMPSGGLPGDPLAASISALARNAGMTVGEFAALYQGSDLISFLSRILGYRSSGDAPIKSITEADQFLDNGLRAVYSGEWTPQQLVAAFNEIFHPEVNGADSRGYYRYWKKAQRFNSLDGYEITAPPDIIQGPPVGKQIADANYGVSPLPELAVLFYIRELMLPQHQNAPDVRSGSASLLQKL